MSSYNQLNNNQNQQYPFTDNVKAGSHMELIAIISVVLVFILISFNLYVKYRHRHRVIITIHRTGGATPPTPANTGGLDAVAISSLPTFIYRGVPSTNDKTDECVVCLSVAEEGEIMRMLPECKHVFHIDCIDMWLHSNSTCPVCRASVKQTTNSELGELLAMPPLPERFGRGVSESSRFSSVGNEPRRWTSMNGVVDLERQ